MYSSRVKLVLLVWDTKNGAKFITSSVHLHGLTTKVENDFLLQKQHQHEADFETPKHIGHSRKRPQKVNLTIFGGKLHAL